MDPSHFLEASPAKWGWSLRRPGLGLASSFAELSSHHAGHKEVMSSPSTPAGHSPMPRLSWVPCSQASWLTGSGEGPQGADGWRCLKPHGLRLQAWVRQSIGEQGGGCLPSTPPTMKQPCSLPVTSSPLHLPNLYKQNWPGIVSDEGGIF